MSETKSIYEEQDGFNWRELHRQPAPENVGSLIEILQKLPKDLPVNHGFEEGVKLVWFNVGRPNEYVGFEENDGTYDDSNMQDIYDGEDGND